MLQLEDFQLIAKFQTALSKEVMNHIDSDPFSVKAMNLFQEMLGFNQMFFGYLNYQGRNIPKGAVLHGLELEFFIQFREYYYQHQNVIEQLNDISVFHEIPENSKFKNEFFHEVLEPAGMNDLLLLFNRAPEKAKEQKYISCFGFFSKHVIPDRLINILKFLRPTITYSEQTYVDMWSLKNHISSTHRYMDYFPIGVILIEYLNEVVFSNSLAKQYMAEIGVNEEKYFSTFFVSKLYGYCKDQLISYGSAYPIKYKHLIFNCITVSNPAINIPAMQNYNTKFEDNPTLMKQLSLNSAGTAICIYILRDDVYRPSVSVSEMSTFGFTTRETEVSEMIASGLSDKEIAEQLNISKNTVRIHITNIYKKAKVKNRQQFVSRVLKNQPE